MHEMPREEEGKSEMKNAEERDNWAVLVVCLHPMGDDMKYKFLLGEVTRFSSRAKRSSRAAAFTISPPLCWASEILIRMPGPLMT